MDSNDPTTDNPVLVWVSETVTPVKGIRQLTYVSARLVVRRQRSTRPNRRTET